MLIQFDLSRETFLAEYQEKKPLLLKQALAVDSFSWRDANEIFERANVASNDFKLSWDGIRPKQEYVERYLDIGTPRHRLIKPVVYDYLQKGATLIANKIYHEPKVNSLVRQIAEFTGRQTVTSAYAAFGEKDSFRCHWDTRDVFAIQLIGRKRWVVYEPTMDSPLYMQQSKDFEQQHPCPEVPYMDFIMEAGDVFYLPRGWWHNPLPLGEETFHLAVGTFPPYAIDYAQWAFQHLSDFVEARRSLLGWEQDCDNLLNLSQQLSTFISNPDNYQRFMDEFIGSTRVDSPLAIDLFGQSNGGQMAGDTPLRLSANTNHGLSNGYVIANGTRLKLDDTGRRLVGCIAKRPGICLDEVLNELNDLDNSKLRTLIWQLCQQDVLELARH